jgi:hypothetical protein
MNDLLMVSLIAAGVVCAVVAFAMFHVFSGVHGSLSSARAGDIFNFEYKQPLNGEPERYMAKVLDVCTLDDSKIMRLNARSRYRKNDPNFQRSKHLVTARMPNGEVRNFYAERATNVRRPLLGSVLFKSGIAAMIF